MKNFLTLVAITLPILLWSQQLEPAEKGSSIIFKIKNFGVSVDGTLSGLKGKIFFNPNDLGSAIFDVTVNANTVNTNIDMRDNHLRKPDYLDATAFPVIRFVSTKVETTTTTGKYLIIGNLTVKNKTKEIKFPFTVQQQGNGSLFKGSFLINRRDFNIGGGSFSMADELTVDLKVLATAPKL